MRAGIFLYFCFYISLYVRFFRMWGLTGISLYLRFLLMWALPLSISGLSFSGLSLFFHGGESISPYVTKVTRFRDTPVSPCPERMGATPQRMAGRAETRGRPHTAHDAHVRLQVPEETADFRGGLPTPSSGHTNAFIHTITYQAIDQTYPVHGTCFDYGVKDCDCCEHEVVGTEDASSASFWGQSKIKKSMRNSFVDAAVGTVGNSNSNGNRNSKGNDKHVRFRRQASHYVINCKVNFHKFMCHADHRFTDMQFQFTLTLM